jgi:uracil-DNA glycosylase
MVDQTETLGAAEFLHPHDAVVALKALFQWYEAVGVDEPLAEVPRNFFAEFKTKSEAVAPPVAPRPALHRPVEQRPRPSAPLIASPNEAVAEAQALAAHAGTLAQLRAALELFEGCTLRRSAQNLVFGSGVEHPRVMVMGETPDRDDDNSGQPFSGLRGILLQRMLRSIGILPDQSYLSQIVPWFPPGNMMPAKHHIDACLPFALRHIELSQPQSLICLGWAAEKLNIDIVSAGFGTFSLENHTIPVLTLPDLGEIMRSAARKRKAWEGLLKLKTSLSPH